VLPTEPLHGRSGIRNTMKQMPAVATPQSSGAPSRLPHPANPVLAIDRPEVAARAVVYTAAHRRRCEYGVRSASQLHGLTATRRGAVPATAATTGAVHTQKDDQ
jgi:hypothetical protein